MPDRTLEDVRAAIETWVTVRTSLAEKFTQDGLKRFVETSDAQARNLIAALDRRDREFYEGLAELSNVAIGILERRKVFVDGQDATPLR